MATHAAEQEMLVEAMPFNKSKPLEYGHDNSVAPAAGQAVSPPSASTGAGTLSEKNASAKTGTPAAKPAALDGALPSKRVNDTGQALTTNQGVAIADNQNSLKAGLRGPTLLEDFILREKITHFDHERIPERIVHARGSGAHGFFECYDSFTSHTKAAPFTKKGKITPVFVRFSTVAGNGARRIPRAMSAVCREVLHRRGELGSGRQQHPGILHPGRDEVPRPHSRGEAGASPPDARRRRRLTTPSGISSR